MQPLIFMEQTQYNMNIDVNNLSDEDFDTIADLALELAYTQLDFIETVTDSVKANLIRTLLSANDLDELSISVDHNITESWWLDANEIFESMEEEDDYENKSAEDKDYALIEAAITTVDQKSNELTTVVSCLFKVYKAENFCKDDLNKVIVQWLPELNDL